MRHVKTIIANLQTKYPGREIICDPPTNPMEIIVEIEPTGDHPDRSLALAVVGKSKSHYHQKSTEVYEVVKGTLTLVINGTKHLLKAGEKMTIHPFAVHHAEGDEAWFLTYSTPGWTVEDHILR